MEYDRVNVDPANLLLDPNNYRFHDLPNYSEVKKKARYQENGVQIQAMRFLRETTAFDLNALKARFGLMVIFL